MIGKILPNVDYKLIKDNSYIAVNLLKKNPNSTIAAVAYRYYLSEGKKAPGYAQTIMKLMKNDSSLNDIRQMLDDKMPIDEFEKRSINLINGFVNISNKNIKEKLEFDKAGKKMYPKTWEIRKNILNWWRDTSEHKYKTSQFKDLKRDFWGTMEKVNPKIAEFRSK